MNYITVIVTLSLAAQAFAIKYTDCGSKTGKVIDVYLSGCENDDVCELKRGETYSHGLTFESLTESQTLKVVVHGIVGGISMPYPHPNADACKDSNVECPLENGKTYMYGNEIEVRKSYPAVKADVKWELKDENNQNVACVLVPVKIV